MTILTAWLLLETAARNFKDRPGNLPALRGAIRRCKNIGMTDRVIKRTILKVMVG